jgi:hypothetical protein
MKTIKAYSSKRDSNARWPNKNITDVTPAALINTHEEDDFSHLLLAAPTVDISNLDKTKLTSNDNIEVYKQKVVVSCQNLLTVAQNALSKHPQLKKVVIMEHAPRYDVSDVDPTGIKPKLAKYANSSLAQMWHDSAMKDRIVIGKHSLDCGGDQIAARYRDDWSGRYDGVHMYGRNGKNVYTRSVLQIIKSVLPTPHTAFPSSSSSSSFHSSCPQTQYQRMQKNKTSTRHQQNESIYTVPVSNHFDILGN